MWIFGVGFSKLWLRIIYLLFIIPEEWNASARISSVRWKQKLTISFHLFMRETKCAIWKANLCLRWLILFFVFFLLAYDITRMEMIIMGFVMISQFIWIERKWGFCFISKTNTRNYLAWFGQMRVELMRSTIGLSRNPDHFYFVSYFCFFLTPNWVSVKHKQPNNNNNPM